MTHETDKMPEFIPVLIDRSAKPAQNPAPDFKSLKVHDFQHNKINYKFNEENILKEVREYIDATYGQHYAQDKLQQLEMIIDQGHGTGFCIGNIGKYSGRYGKKIGEERKDLMKVIHYGILQLYIHDMEKK